MGWLYLAIAILFEIAGTTAMKLSDGFTRLVPSILLFACYFVAFGSLTFALRHLDLSLAYAIWAGLGTAIIAIIGIVWFDEPAGALKLVSVGLIIAGVIGLHLADGHA